MADVKKTKFILLSAMTVTFLAGVVFIYFSLFPRFTPPVLPVPNGYDELLRAAELLPDRTGFYRDMDDDELRTVVEGNAKTLENASEALEKECMVLVDWSPGKDGFTPHLAQGRAMRKLARAWAASARLATKNGNSQEAFNCGLQCFGLAGASARGGLIVDRQLAFAIHGMGLQIWRNLVPSLGRSACEQLSENLKLLPIQLEPLNKVIKRDLAFGRRSHGAFASLMMRGAVQRQIQQTKNSTQASEMRIEANRALLQGHLALRAYQLDKEQLPETLEELVPTYLPKLPVDAFSEGSLVYRRSGESYRLYSVDSNGVDDQGVETTSEVPGDLLLEVLE